MNKKKTDIILIVLDSARSDFFGCYGHEGNLTPNIDALAKQGWLCRNNYAAGNGSAMAHTSLFLGQHAARHRMVHNLTEMPEHLVALPSILKAHGYKSYGHLQVSFIPPAGYEERFGFDELLHPGNRKVVKNISLKKRLLEFLKSRPVIWNAAKKIYGKLLGDEGRVRASAASFDGSASINYILDRMKSAASPQFLYTTLMHPHTPYYPPKWCVKKVFGNRKIDKMAYRIQLDFHGWMNGNYGSVERGIEDLKGLYQAELVYADHLIGKLVEGLKAQGKFENTILVVTADHGELLGEHGWINHGNTVWDEVYRVPLVISYPQVIKPEIIQDLTSNLDIVPTVCDLVGHLSEAKKMTVLDGHSFFSERDIFNGRTLIIDSPPVVLPGRLKEYTKIMALARTISRAVVDEKFKYIWHSTGEEFLFHLGSQESPDKNIFQSEKSVVESMKGKLVRFYKGIDEDYKLDHYPLTLTKSLGHKFGNPLIVNELKKLGYM